MTERGVRMFRTDDLQKLQERLAEGEMGCITPKQQVFMMFEDGELVLLNEKVSALGAEEPADAAEGFVWRESDQNGNFSAPYAWVRKGNRWVSDRVFNEVLTGQSEGDIIRTSPIQAAVTGENFADQILVEDIQVYVGSDVADDAPGSHSLEIVATRPGVAKINTLLDLEEGDFVGPLYRSQVQPNQVVSLENAHLFKLNALAGDLVAEALVSAQINYRLVRPEPVVSGDEAPAAA